jgi:hypothetical protein
MNNDGLSAFLGGGLDRRLRPSTSFERNDQPLDEHLTERFSAYFTAGGAPPAPRPIDHIPSQREEDDFQRLAVRRMVEQFGGNVRALDRDDRLRREARMIEEVRFAAQRDLHGQGHSADDPGAAGAIVSKWLSGDPEDEDGPDADAELRYLLQEDDDDDLYY